MRLKGFTLVESILVTSVILLVGSAVGVFSTQFLSARNTAIAAHLLRESLDRAQVYARSGRMDTDWGVTQVGPDIVIFSGATYALRAADQDERVIMPGGISLSGLGETVFSHTSGLIPAEKVIHVSGTDRTLHISVSTEGGINEYE